MDKNGDMSEDALGKSLEMLNPKPWASRKHNYTSETAKELEQMTHELLLAASARDWDNPVFKHIIGEFTAEFEHNEGRVLDSWRAYIEHHEMIAQTNPGYRFDVLNTAADVYESSGKAIIYALLKVFDHPKDVVRESIILMQWCRRDNEWKCYKERVIRGMDWNT